MTRRDFLLAAPLLGGAAGCLALDPRVLLEPPVDPAALSDGNTDFAFDLYAQLRKRAGNLLVSPFCIATSLAMAGAATQGETRAEFDRVLHRTPETDPKHAGDAALQRQIAAGLVQSGCELRSAYALWAHRELPIHDEFRKLAATRYAGALQTADFKKPDAAARAINNWSEIQTSFKIKGLMAPASLSDSTRLVLASGAYFKGLWAKTFAKAVSTYGTFQAPDGKHPALFMRQRAEYFAFEDDSARALEIPFAGGALNWFMAMPQKADGMAALEESLRPELLHRFDSQKKPVKCEVALPRCRLTVETPLREPLEAIGLSRAFQPGDADWSGLTKETPLALHTVVHKAVIDINEEGVSGAAATSDAVRPSKRGQGDEAVVYSADRPFIVAIRDSTSRSVLFLGRVEKP